MLYYHSLNSYLTERFGEKVYKLALDGGFTCPNRDGSKGRGGCIFCLEGSGGFAVNCQEDIDQAIEDAKSVIGKKGKTKFIAYFQSFTNTYAPMEKLRRIYMSAANRDDIVAISIATRPDCVGDDVIELLKEINSIKPVFVELGLQTIHEKTAEYINRCYTLDVYDECMKKLNEANIETVVHMIIGLPGENKEMMVKTASYIRKSGAKGIKFQLLHVLKGTKLEKDYSEGRFSTLSLEEYIDILKSCVEQVGTDMVIHRLTGDGDKRYLVSPLWSADKKRVLNEIRKEIRPIEEQRN